ncbi:hypothetical protein KCP77_16645 [Salmonella enterica subsp. enterica]|nr:hypothetical protein KCP77_16645 [Salmonella enterica subsp. enterica]
MRLATAATHPAQPLAQANPLYPPTLIFTEFLLVAIGNNFANQHANKANRNEYEMRDEAVKLSDSDNSEASAGETLTGAKACR